MREVQAIICDVLAIELESPATDLLETALLDSLGLVLLLRRLEQRFDMRLPVEAFELEDFRSARSIARLVLRQRELARASAGCVAP